MTATTRSIGRPARSVWLGAIGTSGGVRLDRHGVVAPDGATWELDWAVGDADGWRMASDEAAMRQVLLESTPVVTTALRVPDGAVEETCWIAVGGDGPVLVAELHNAAPVAVAVALVIRPRRGTIGSIDLDGTTVSVDGRIALTFGRLPSRSVVGSTDAVHAAVLAGLAESTWPDGGGRSATGDLAAAFVFPLPHTATLRLALPTGASGAGDVAALPTAQQVAAGWRAQTAVVPRVDLPEGDAEVAFASAACHVVARAGDGHPTDPDGVLLPGLVRCELAMALDELGLHHAARALLVAMIDEQRSDGAFDPDLLDATAAWLVALEHDARLSGDDDLVVESIERIASAAHWLHRRHVGSRLRRSSQFFGRGAGRDMSTDDDARRARDARWARRAFDAAARMLRAVGQVDAAALVDEHAIELVHAMAERSIVDDGDGSGRPPVHAIAQLRSLLAEGAPCWTWPSATDGDDPLRAAEFVRLVRALLVDDSGPGIAIVPQSIDDWIGRPLAVHGLPTAFGPLSFALRWHGPRPALLWDLEPHPRVDGSTIRLAAPGLDGAWTSTERRSEALLSEPPHEHRHDEGDSFS